MSAPPTARAAAADETRRRLIDAAIARFAADGLGARFDQVAADAGVTKGALYHHFGSKDGLVEAVYREAVNRHARQVVDASSSGTGRERLLGLVDESARLYTSRTPFYLLLISLHHLAATSRPELAGIAHRVMQAQRDYMVGLVRTGQADGSISPDRDAEAIGVTVNAALMGFLTQQLEHEQLQLRWVAKFRSLLEDLL